MTEAYSTGRINQISCSYWTNFQISLLQEKFDKLLIELYFLQYTFCKKEEIVCIKRTIYNIPLIDNFLSIFVWQVCNKPSNSFSFTLLLKITLVNIHFLKCDFFISKTEMNETFISFYSLLKEWFVCNFSSIMCVHNRFFSRYSSKIPNMIFNHLLRNYPLNKDQRIAFFHHCWWFPCHDNMAKTLFQWRETICSNWNINLLLFVCPEDKPFRARTRRAK